MERDISRSCGKVPVVVAAAVALPLLIAFVPSRLGQFLCFLLQQLIQRLFHTAPDQLFKLPLDYFLI